MYKPFKRVIAKIALGSDTFLHPELQFDFYLIITVIKYILLIINLNKYTYKNIEPGARCKSDRTSTSLHKL